VLKYAKKPIDDLINQNLKICTARWIAEIYDTPFLYTEGFGFNSLTKISWLVSVAVILILAIGRPNKDWIESKPLDSVAE
jgi:hypothetical protein